LTSIGIVEEIIQKKFKKMAKILNIARFPGASKNSYVQVAYGSPHAIGDW
jgi:hypothetical protein